MSYKILNQEDDKKKFSENWNLYINENIASTRYTENFISYYLEYGNVLNESFIVIKENKPVGIAFVPIEKKNQTNSISINDEFVIAPLSNDKKGEELIFNNINKIAKKNSVSKIKFEVDPLTSIYDCNYNYLTDYQYLNTNSTSYLIDLRISKEKFFSNLNQSTRHSIKKFIEKNEYKINFYSGKYVKKDIFDNYQNLHFKSAGRMTRSQKTFDIQYKMINNSEAILTCLTLKGKELGYLFTSVFQNTASLFSIANNPEYENDYPIYKVMMFEIFKFLKKQRYQFALFGRPSSKNSVQGFLDYANEKELRISKYKRGYRPYIIENFRGIKYLELDSMTKDIDIFKKEIQNQL